MEAWEGRRLQLDGQEFLRFRGLWIREDDEAVLGAVRAWEAVGFRGQHDRRGHRRCGIGNQRVQEAVCNRLLGTVIVSPKRHGYETALNMYDWVANNKDRKGDR